MLSGLLPPTEGSLYVNHTSIKGIWANKYRSQVGQVLPEQNPFEGTILENITLGDSDISKKYLDEVLEVTRLFNFVKEQPDGLHTMLYPEGQQIPLTVTKRIVLARAIVNQPKFLLLKNPLEYFETAEAKQIITYLTAPERPWALVVATRSTLWNTACSRIITLENGRLRIKND